MPGGNLGMGWENIGLTNILLVDHWSFYLQSLFTLKNLNLLLVQFTNICKCNFISTVHVLYFLVCHWFFSVPFKILCNIFHYWPAAGVAWYIINFGRVCSLYIIKQNLVAWWRSGLLKVFNVSMYSPVVLTRTQRKQYPDDA